MFSICKSIFYFKNMSVPNMFLQQITADRYFGNSSRPILILALGFFNVREYTSLGRDDLYLIVYITANCLKGPCHESFYLKCFLKASTSKVPVSYIFDTVSISRIYSYETFEISAILKCDSNVSMSLWSLTPPC